MRNLSQWGAVCSLDFVLKQAVNGFLKQKSMSERGLPRMPYRYVFSKIKAFLKSKNIMDYKTTLKSLRSVYKLSQRKKTQSKTNNCNWCKRPLVVRYSWTCSFRYFFKYFWESWLTQWVLQNSWKDRCYPFLKLFKYSVKANSSLVLQIFKRNKQKMSIWET